MSRRSKASATRDAVMTDEPINEPVNREMNEAVSAVDPSAPDDPGQVPAAGDEAAGRSDVTGHHKPEGDDGSAGKSAELAGTQYLVLRAITGDQGRTFLPGEVVAPDGAWPFYRARQLTEQGYLLPLQRAAETGGSHG